MSRTHLPALLVATLLLCSAPAAAGVSEDMVALDRVYVPALVLTNRPDAEPARRAIAALRAEWNVFRARYAVAPLGYSQAAWDRANATMEAAIVAAEKNAAAGKGPAAHDDLEAVREAQYTLRRDAGVPYFLDDLTAFHAAMERIASAVGGRNANTLTDGEVAAVRAALPEAERTWAVVVANRAQVARHIEAPERVAAAQAQIDAESASLAALRTAVAAGDREGIATSGNALKPGFSKLFSLFGAPASK
jgi:hypothetical protein